MKTWPRLFMISLFFSGPVFCQEEAGKAASGNLSLSAVDKYLFRGRNYHDNAAVQPCAEATWKDMTLGFWGTVNFFEDSTKGFHEADAYFSCDKPLLFNGRLALSLGYNLYSYPKTYGVRDKAVDHEFSTGLAVDVPASPYVIYYLSPTDRFSGLRAQYLEAGAGHDIEIKGNFTLSLAASAGYALARAGGAWKGNASVLGLSVSTAYSEVVDISPIFFYQIPLSKGYADNYYLGLTVSYGFEF